MQSHVIYWGDGRKTVEVRLNDEKRRKIRYEDIIESTRLPEEKEWIRVRVVDLTVYQTFEDMYNDIPWSAMDCDGWTI